MGVIQRQTFKNNLFAYAAVAIGAFAQLCIYTDNVELKGHADALLKWAQLLVPFFVLGMTTVAIRFIPYLNTTPERAAAQLFARSLAVVGSALLLATVVNLIWGEAMVTYLEASGYEVDKLANYRWEILALLGVLSLSAVVTAHLTNFKRIAVPVVFNSLLLKAGLPLIFLLVVYNVTDKAGFTLGLILLYLLALLGLVGYAAYLGVFRLEWGKLEFKDDSFKGMVSLGGYSILGSLGSVLATHLDTVSVNTYVGDFDTGVYSFAVFAMLIIAVPFKAVNTIASPIVAQAWKEKDMQQISELYKGTSRVLFAAGGFIYTGMIVCLPYVYLLTDGTRQYTVGYQAAIFLGAGMLFDQLTSINNTLIIYSDYFRWNVLFIVILGVMNVFLNYYFIVTLEYGLTGAAIATMISLFLYNLAKGGFVYWKMGMHPFSSSLLYSAAFFLFAGSLALLVPGPENALLNILLRGSIITVLFFVYLRYTNGVPALRRALQNGWKAMF